MTDQATKAEAFRKLHDAPGIFVIPNPWDIGTARILTGLGYQALATTSAGYAFSQGRVEGVTSREEMLKHCAEIVAATPLPVSADFENGFGHTPEAAAETIVAAGAAGLVGGSIEDATGDPDQPIYDFELAVERVAASVEAAQAYDFPFTFTARTENFLWGRPDLDDTIKRLQAFEAAGADVLYAPGLPNLEAVRTVCSAVTKPVNVVVGLVNLDHALEEFAEAGVKRISLGSAFNRVAYDALLRAAREILNEGTFKNSFTETRFADIERFMAKD